LVAPQAGLAGLPLIVAMGLAQLLVDALERYPRAFATLVGMATLAAGLAAVAIWLDRGYVAIAAGYVLCGIGLRIVMQTVAVAILDALPRADAGLASALGDTLQEIGAALGVAAVATLLTAALGSTPVLSSPVVFEDTMRQGLLWCSALVLAAGAFAAWALRGVEPAETVAVPADRSGQAA